METSPVPLTANWRVLLVARNLPELTLRSTFIVGFPAKWKKTSRCCRISRKEARLDRVGFFRTAREGAGANDLPDQVPEEERRSSRKSAMQLQQQISAERW